METFAKIGFIALILFILGFCYLPLIIGVVPMNDMSPAEKWLMWYQMIIGGVSIGLLACFFQKIIKK